MMKKIAAIFILLVLVGLGCKKDTPTSVDVVTTILPVTSVAQNLLRDVASVSSVVSVNADPHDISLSTRELQQISNAKIIVTWGKGLDDWATSAISAAGGETSVIEASSFITDPLSDDPHAWLSPRKMMQVTEGLSRVFIEQFPNNEEQIRENTKEYLQELAALDTSFKALATMPNRDIVTLHDAFGYMAEDYGLTILGTVKDLPEDAPSPQDVAAIISALQQYPRAALFAESEISPNIIDVIARDTGRTVHILDPIEVTDAASSEISGVYVSVMQENLRRLLEALGGK